MTAILSLLLILSALANAGSHKISFKLKLEGHEESGNFILQDASQGNYVLGGDAPYEATNEKGQVGLEFKKYGTIVNLLATDIPGKPGTVFAEVQVELTRPLPSKETKRSVAAKTFQFQTAFEAPKGRPVVLVDGADKRIEIQIEDSAPSSAKQAKTEDFKVTRMSGSLRGLGVISERAQSGALGGRRETPSEPSSYAPGPGAFRIWYKLKLADHEDSGSFVAQNGSQSNYVLGGHDPVEIMDGNGRPHLAVKMSGVIVNCLPVSPPDKPDEVRVQVQVEISGPGRPETVFRERSIQTFQLQTDFTAAKGRSVVLVDEADKRVEFRIEDFKP